MLLTPNFLWKLSFTLMIYLRFLSGSLTSLVLHVCVLSCFSHVRPFVTPWTVAHQVLLSMGFSRQEYWNGLPRPPPGDLHNSGVKIGSLVSLELTGGLFNISATLEAPLS